MVKETWSSIERGVICSAAHQCHFVCSGKRLFSGEQVLLPFWQRWESTITFSLVTLYSYLKWWDLTFRLYTHSSWVKEAVNIFPLSLNCALLHRPTVWPFYHGRQTSWFKDHRTLCQSWRTDVIMCNLKSPLRDMNRLMCKWIYQPLFYWRAQFMFSFSQVEAQKPLYWSLFDEAVTLSFSH